ncbi:MAG: MraY family glycosyltransferase [Bryobacteraceae bacterium]|jgi:UDP-GlcNAc:undecaprenyl-phosphate GlcNAc-1-phosphate transferase
MNLTGLMLACGKAFIFSVALTPIARDVFRSYNVVDRPGRRKVHSYPIPRVGGIPIAIAYVIALNSLRGPGSVFPLHWLQTILSGAAIVFLAGLIDDFLNIKPVVKLAGQIAAAAVAFANGLSIDRVGGIALPVWLSLLLTVFWLLLTTNAFNLIDGLDGLSGGIAFWATLAFFAVGITHGNTALAYTALPLAGALLGFLVFNFSPATVFLGDSGALTIGFLLGCYGIVWTGHQVTGQGLAIPLLALCVPLMDLGLAIVRRRLKKQPIFSADRGHIHHRLLERGLSVRRVAVILYAVGIAGGLSGLTLSYTGGNVVLRAIVIAGLAIAAMAGVRELRYPEFEVAGRLLFRGEFHTVFAERLRMKQLAQTLERAKTGEEWWQLLVAAARQWNWVQLKWISPGGLRDEVLAVRKPSWSFVIQLSDAESVQVEGIEPTTELSPDLIALSAILRRTFQRGLREWEQPALS